MIIPDEYILKVGIATAFVLIGMALLCAWLIYVARLSVDCSEDDEDAFASSNPSSPVAIHTTTESVLWKIAKSNPQPKRSSRLNNSSVASKVQFEIIGEDDDDERL